MNTIGTSTLSGVNRVLFSATFQEILKKAMIAEEICAVDRSDSKYITNPYGSEPTAVVQAVAGTYSVSAFTTTDDNLTVADEVIYGEHILGFEQVFSRYDLKAARYEQMAYAVSYALDKWVVNNLCEDGTGTYSTPAGGFTTAGNFLTIIGNLFTKVTGFQAIDGYYLVLESGDLAGVWPAMASNGFTMADNALREGMLMKYGNIDIHIVRAGTFVDEAATTVSGTKTWTNLGHRVFGVKRTSTYCTPRDLTYEEKGVTGKTGVEIDVWALVGHKVWNNKATLTVDITLV